MRNVCGWLAGAMMLAGCTIMTEDKPAPSGGASNGNANDPQSGSGASGGSTTPGSSGAPDKAHVRVVHASPDAPAVDVYVKGIAAPVIQNLAYGDSTKYLDLDEGAYDFELRASPSKPSDPVAYSTGALTVKMNTKTTAVAAGLLGSSDAASKFRVLAFADGSAAVPAGKTLVRVIHASADAPTVGIDVGNDDPSSPEIASLDRFAAFDSAQLPSGTQLQIGVDAGGQRVTSFTTPKLPDAGAITVIATGLVGKLAREKAGFSLLAIGDNGSIGFIRQNPIVYALHAGPDAPAIDAYAGTARVVSNLSFGQLAGPLQVPTGNLKVRIFGANDNPLNTPVAEPSLGDLKAGERYLAIATGYLTPAAGTQPFQVLSVAEGFALDDAGNSRARVVHACPNAPAVDVGPVANNAVTPAIANLPFGNASDSMGLSLPPAQLLTGLAPADYDTSIVARFTLPTLAGTRGFVVAAGALGHSTRPLRLAIVETSTNPWRISHVFSH